MKNNLTTEHKMVTLVDTMAIVTATMLSQQLAQIKQ